jgi:FtsH-binding integral membrane protein
MVMITLVITIWAPLTLATAQKSTTDRTLYVLFSVFLAAQLGVTFLLGRSFHRSYVSAGLMGLLILLSLAGSLLLLLLGVTLSLARRHERPVGTVIAACLSGAVFIALCVALLR